MIRFQEVCRVSSPIVACSGETRVTLSINLDVPCTWSNEDSASKLVLLLLLLLATETTFGGETIPCDRSGGARNEADPIEAKEEFVVATVVVGDVNGLFMLQCCGELLGVVIVVDEDDVEEHIRTIGEWQRIIGGGRPW